MNYQIHEIPTEDFLNSYDKKLVARLITHYPNQRVNDLEERVETLEQQADDYLTDADLAPVAQIANDAAEAAENATNALTSKADLVNSKVPASQLPSYVDDIIEGTLTNSTTFTVDGQLVTPESGKIYVDTSTNKQYRWSGSLYSEVSQSLALGETSSTAGAGDKTKAAYDHSQSSHAPADASSSTIVENEQTDSYALLASDRNKHLALNKSTAINLTINDVFTAGWQCTGEQKGAGQVTILPGSGVTLRSAEGALKTRVQYSGFSIRKTSVAGEYIIYGDLTA